VTRVPYWLMQKLMRNGMMTDHNMSAFPHSEINYKMSYMSGQVAPERGMTLRDWFAGQALSRGLAKNVYMDGEGIKSIAKAAYQMADEMLTARDKSNG